MPERNKYGVFATILGSYSFWLMLLTLVTYGRVWQIQDVIWDDNAWLRAIYSTDTLGEFLKKGFENLRREPLGVFFYWFFRLHRDTNLFFTVWHGLDLFILALTAVVLCVLISRLFKNRYLGFFSGIAFIAFPLDYTIGYASAINYRIALLLMTMSLVLSISTAMKPAGRYLLFVCSLLTAALAQYVFLEASLCLEPGRLLMFAFVSGASHWYRREHLRVALRRSIPFLLLSLPLVVFKLSEPTSGVHAGLYRPDIMHLVDIRLYAVSLAHFFFFPWVVLGLNAASIQSGTLFAMLVVMAIVVTMLYQISMADRASVKTDEMVNKKVSRQDASRIILFALASIVPVFLLFQLIGRPISWGLDSTHAVLCQLGYALLIGYLLNRFWSWQLRSQLLRMAAWVPALITGCIIGIGVFFSNLNIDQYRASWRSQSSFLVELLGRFPSLPQDIYIIADVHSKDLYSDIRYSDIEFPVNLLYAQSAVTKEFYRYKIITAEDFQPFAHVPAEVQRSGKVRIDLASDYGTQTMDINRFIFIYYRDGELLVNQEIAARFPDIEYKSWLDRTFPEQGQETSSFPLRTRFVFAPRANG